MASSDQHASALGLIDPLPATSERVPPQFRFAPDFRSWAIPLAIGVGLLLLSLVALLGGEEMRRQFLFSYVVGWSFCLSITLGALCFVMVQHLTKASWVVAVRRIPEVLIWNFPLLFVLSIPILIGMHDLYHWTHHDLLDPAGAHYDEILAGKSSYLNIPFFIVRLILYFAIWTYMAYRLYRLSVDQDVNPDPTIPARQRKVSAWGVPVFALTTAFASYDVLMSLDPHWFSTMFGVYFFAGGWVAAIATITLIAIFYHRRPGSVVTIEHLHDLGKLLFGFIVFWAYIAFSQYFLIWYGNIPEETIFFIHRLRHGWGGVSAALLFGHFIFPFLFLLPRFVKRSPGLLGFGAVWVLAMHFLDLYWIALPVLEEEFVLHWLNVALWLGMVGLFAAVYVARARRHSLVPFRDPYFDESLRFTNV